MPENSLLGHSGLRSPWLEVRIAHSFANLQLRLDCSFSAARTVVFGPSGSGKSSLLRAVAGLLEPDSGMIKLDGETIWERATINKAKSRARHSLPAQNRDVGLVPQTPAIFPHLTASSNVGFALRHMEKPARKEKVRELLELVDAGSLEDRWPRELSGGQLQRVAIARTLAAEPFALLLDEPFAALDAQGRQKLSENISRWANQRRVPIILVTHNLEEAFSAAEEVLVLDGGAVIAQGKPDIVLAKERARLLKILGAWIGNN